MNIKSILSWWLSVSAIAVVFSIGITECDSKSKREPQRASKGAILYWGAPAATMWIDQQHRKINQQVKKLKELIEKLDKLSEQSEHVPQPVAAPAK